MKLARSFLAILFLTNLFLPVDVAATTADSSINIDVKEFTLKNGMVFLVVERPETPQVACRLAIRAGSALESTGQTGIAHMLEHMLFKGTKNFGSLDWQKDQDLQNKIESAYQIITAEQSKRQPNEELIQAKKEEMARLRAQVQQIYVPQAFSSQLGKNGAVGVNAFTTKDQTQYTASVPSDMVEQWFSIASEQIFEPAWREFYVEKEVIQREWAFRYINNPGGAAWLDLFSTAYTAHPYRNPVIGWKDDMARFSTNSARAFHERFYHPANAVCVLVGDITEKKARKLAETYFSRYAPGNRAPETVTAEPAQHGPREQVRYLKGARTPLVRIGFHAAPMGTSDFFALDALNMILSHGRSARLSRELVDKGLATRAWAYNPDNRYGGMVILGGSPVEQSKLTPEATQEERRRAALKACRQLESRLLEQVEQLKTSPVSVQDLSRIIKLNRRDFIDRLRGNDDLAGTLATLEIQYGWRYLTEYLENMEKVTPELIKAAAHKYLREENRTTVFVIPGGTPSQPPEPYEEVRSVGTTSAATLSQPTDLSNHSIFPTPAEWQHPLSFQRKPSKIRYPKADIDSIQGARFFYMPDRQLPLVDLTLFVKAGAIDIPEAKTGLDDLLSATLIRGGTEKLNPDELALTLDANAIDMSFKINEEYTMIQLSVLKDEWEKGLALLTSVLTTPRFDADIMATTKSRMLTVLKRQGGSAESVVQREWFIWHFKDHPYGRDPLVGLDTIPLLTADDCLQFLKQRVVPANMTVAVSGDISRQRARDGLTRLLSALPNTPKIERTIAPPATTPPALILVHKPGQIQSQIMLGMTGVPRSHPDFWKLRLLTDILGGQDSLMYKRLRDDLGLVYSAGFFQAYRWQAGLLMGYIGCRGDKTDQAIAETIQLINRLKSSVPAADFTLKRLDALNSFVFNVDSPAALVSTYATYDMRKEPLNTLENIQEQFITAKKDDMVRLAQDHFDTNRLKVVVVADKTTPVMQSDGTRVSLETVLKTLANEIGLPYKELALR